MSTKFAQDNIQRQSIAEMVKNWVMVALTLILVLLYGAILFGWLKPLTDVTMITRLEPIIFVIIGYYFGRLPAQHNEQTLRDEIGRQTQRADAAQQVKEQLQQTRKMLEEKMKDARIVLVTASQATPLKEPNHNISKAVGAEKDNALHQAVGVVLNILDS